MSTKHYYVFNNFSGKCLDKDRWDMLRTDGTNPDFGLEATQEEFESTCQKRSDCQTTATCIDDCLINTNTNCTDMISLGAGKGIVEWHLKKLRPDMRLTCADFTEQALSRLKKLFPSCDQFLTFDILKDDYTRFPRTAIILMHRISTEFTLQEWISIFERIHHAGIEHILFVPTELASIRLKITETVRHYARRIIGKKDTFCGWLYSKVEIERFFSGYEIVSRVPHADSAIYLLKRTNA